jgi:hypothetical protein
MAADRVKRIIREDVDKDKLIDIADLLRSTRKTAGEHAGAMGLAGRQALRIAGFSAYELQAKLLPELTLGQGGVVIEDDNFPGTELRSFQPICRYGRVLFGKASIPDAGELPTRNVTRSNGAKVNVLLGSATFLPGLEPAAPTEDVVYVLLLTCRDRNDLARYQHVAIAALEPDFSGFIFYESLDHFIAGYGEICSEIGTHGATSPATASLGLELKKGVTPFQGSEAQGGDATGSDKKSP